MLVPPVAAVVSGLFISRGRTRPAPNCILKCKEKVERRKKMKGERHGQREMRYFQRKNV